LAPSNSASANEVVEKARKLVALQLGMMLLVSVAFFAWFFKSGQGLNAVLAVGYGGLTSVASTLLLSFGVKRASDGVLDNPGKSTMILYAGAAQRFILVLVALAFGLKVLELYPVGLFAGFAAAQMAYLVSMYVFKDI